MRLSPFLPRAFAPWLGLSGAGLEKQIPISWPTSYDVVSGDLSILFVEKVEAACGPWAGWGAIYQGSLKKVKAELLDGSLTAKIVDL